MFTGIVQGTCKVYKIIDLENCRRLYIKLSELASDLKQGASISVNGVCLTVVNIDKDCVEFDIISESLNRTNLGYLEIGEYVNIERACRRFSQSCRSHAGFDQHDAACCHGPRHSAVESG